MPTSGRPPGQASRPGWRWVAEAPARGHGPPWTLHKALVANRPGRPRNLRGTAGEQGRREQTWVTCGALETTRAVQVGRRPCSPRTTRGPWDQGGQVLGQLAPARPPLAPRMPCRMSAAPQHQGNCEPEAFASARGVQSSVALCPRRATPGSGAPSSALRLRGLQGLREAVPVRGPR